MKRQGLFGLLMILVASLLTACGGGSTSIADTPTPTQVVITTSAVLLTETGQTKALSARVLDSQGREMTTTVAWESTQPGQISVDSAGQVTALGEGGSAQITARVGELKSAPLLVFHSRVPAGTLLLTDAQIVGEPVETDPGATPSISNSYSVRLRGVAAPSVGQLVLNTETKVVVGRVQVVQTDTSGVHTVTLVLVPLREILPTLRIDETIDLSQAELTIPAAVLDTYDVVREGTRLTFTPKAARESTRLAFTSKTVRTAASVSPAAVSGTVALPPFTECEATVEGAGGAGSLPIVLSKVPGFSLDFKPALDILHTPENGLERLVLASEPSITTDLSLEFSAGFDAKLTCGIDLAVVRIPTPGPLAAFLSGLITFGAGMELSGKMALPGVVKITNVTRRASTLDLGVACPNGGSCSLVSEVGQPTVTNQASITGPDLGDVRLEPSLYGYGKAQLSIGNPIFSSLRFNAFYAKLGAALQTSFASREGQIADAAYQSSYGISALLKAGVDTDFAGLAAWLGLNGVAENLLEFSEPLATSPKGTLTLAQATFQSGERVEATVNFDPETTTFLSIYNIDEVILMRKVGTGPALEVGRSTVGDGLARMSLSFVPESDGTASELYAFVTSRALPAQMLELGRASASNEVKSERMSAGLFHTCALTSAGGLKCWGYNFAGTLGNGSTVNSATPVDVVGLSSGVVAVGSGNSHTCALTSAGSIKCWGNNSFGQLGNGSRTSSTVPVDVIGLGGDAVALSVGTDHACALNRAGGVQCWGYNFAGGLGNGSFTDSDMPVGVTGLDAGVISVSAGGAFTCALTSAGSVKCWGPNGFGQLGNGSTADSAVPVDVTGLGSGVVAVSAGIFQTCAITSAGGLKCWGNNQYGGLGDGSTTNSTVSVDVTGLSSGVVAVDIGQYHSCAITSTGSAKCWGINGSGGLGNGNQTSSTVPVDATGLSGGVVALSIGDFYTCARYSAGGIKCVGSGQFGQLGSDTSPDTFSLVPLTVPGFP